jgi:hypothetical protein
LQGLYFHSEAFLFQFLMIYFHAPMFSTAPNVYFKVYVF